MKILIKIVVSFYKNGRSHGRFESQLAHTFEQPLNSPEIKIITNEKLDKKEPEDGTAEMVENWGKMSLRSKAVPSTLPSFRLAVRSASALEPGEKRP